MKALQIAPSHKRCVQRAVFSPCRATKSVKDCQNDILRCIENVPRRGQNGLNEERAQVFEEAIKILEENGGVQRPASSKLLFGKWKLLFTTEQKNASPVQRTFTGINSFRVFQDIVDTDPIIRILNIVEFGNIGRLAVEADASTKSKPMKDFVPRQGEGWAILGKSLNMKPPREDCRLDIWFSRGAFKFSFLPFEIPYPVPFRLLGDETKAWIDITYLSNDGSFRLSRGSKGTLFVLVKEASNDIL